MKDEAHACLLDEMEDLLEAERSALISGDLDSLTGLLHRKEALIDRLSGLDPWSGDDLGPLRRKAIRNQQLMDHAMAGIRDVARRLTALRRAEDALETYDAAGRRMSFPRPGASVERRA